jgi:hypothetical protein
MNQSPSADGMGMSGSDGKKLAVSELCGKQLFAAIVVLSRLSNNQRSQSDEN